MRPSELEKSPNFGLFAFAAFLFEETFVLSWARSSPLN
jgi:hypothetical protein